MEYVEYQKMIEEVGTRIDPEGDWMPVMFLEKQGKSAIVGIMMGDSEADKNLVAASMYATIVMCNPDSVAWMHTAWSLPEEELEELHKKWPNPKEYEEAYRKGFVIRPRDHPNRQEVVVVSIIGQRGRHEGEGMMMGFIERSKDKPPRISRWKMYDDPEMLSSGRFPEAIKAGFKYALPEGNLDALEKISEQIKQNYERGDNTNKDG